MKFLPQAMLLGVTLAGFSLSLFGQTASPEQMDKALELLRQTPAAPSAVSGPMTSDQEMKAWELLRSVGAAGQSSSTAGRVDGPTDAGIRQAMEKAQREAETKPAGGAPVSQGTLSQELSVVEEEIIKAKAVSTGQTNTIVQQPAPSTAAPAPSAAPASATALPELPPMTSEQERIALEMLREVSREIMGENSAVPAARPATPPPVPVQPVPPAGEAPALAAPAAPPTSQQEALAELLRAYRNDEITAAQYHKERSRLLGR